MVLCNSRNCRAAYSTSTLFWKWRPERGFQCREHVKIGWARSKAHTRWDSDGSDWITRPTAKAILLCYTLSYYHGLSWDLLQPWSCITRLSPIPCIEKPHSRDVTSKTMLRWSRLCDNSLHRRTLCFTRIVFQLEWVHATANASMSAATMSKNSARCIIHNAMMCFFSFLTKFSCERGGGEWRSLVSERRSYVRTQK